MEVRERRRAANPLFGALSIEEARVEERIRTLALCVVGLAVVGGVLSYLRAMLVPLVLASATRYLLAFPVDLLTRRPMHCFGMELCARPSHAEDAPWLVRCASDLLCRLVLPRPDASRRAGSCPGRVHPAGEGAPGCGVAARGGHRPPVQPAARLPAAARPRGG